jgi:hypothetical protein
MSKIPYTGISPAKTMRAKAPRKGSSKRHNVNDKEVANIARTVVKAALRKSLELKYFSLTDNTYSSISYNGTDFFLPFTQIPQGDTDSTRDGDRVELKEFRFRLACKISTTTPVFLRVICFQWKPNSVPVYANILLDQHNTSAAPMTDFNHDLRSEYHILSDDLLEVDTVAHPAIVIEHSIKNLIPYIQFTAGSSTVGTNLVYILAVSDVLTAGPQVIVYSKTLYTDA